MVTLKVSCLLFSNREANIARSTCLPSFCTGGGLHFSDECAQVVALFHIIHCSLFHQTNPGVFDFADISRQPKSKFHCYPHIQNSYQYSVHSCVAEIMEPLSYNETRVVRLLLSRTCMKPLQSVILAVVCQIVE